MKNQRLTAWSNTLCHSLPSPKTVTFHRLPATSTERSTAAPGRGRGQTDFWSKQSGRKKERQCGGRKPELAEVIWASWVVTGYEFEFHLGGKIKKEEATLNIASSGRESLWHRCQAFAHTQHTRQQVVRRVEQLHQVNRGPDMKGMTGFH